MEVLSRGGCKLLVKYIEELPIVFLYFNAAALPVVDHTEGVTESW
jgi:hypothetical protein